MRSAGLVCLHCHTALSSFRTAAVGLAFAGLEAVRSPPSMDLRITGGGAGRDLHTIPATTFQTTNSAAGFGPSFNPQNGDWPQSIVVESSAAPPIWSLILSTPLVFAQCTSRNMA